MVSAFAFSSAECTLPYRVTRPTTVSTLMAVPLTPSVVNRASLILVVIQASGVAAPAGAVSAAPSTTASMLDAIHIHNGLCMILLLDREALRGLKETTSVSTDPTNRGRCDSRFSVCPFLLLFLRVWQGPYHRLRLRNDLSAKSLGVRIAADKRLIGPHKVPPMEPVLGSIGDKCRGRKRCRTFEPADDRPTFLGSGSVHVHCSFPRV